MASKYSIRGTANMTEHDAAIKKSASEVYKYRQQVKNTEKEMNGLNRNLGTATSSFNRFIGSLNTGKIGSLTSSLGGLTSALGGLGGNVGNITSSLGAMGGNLTALINPYAAVTSAVIGASVAFYKYNVELDKTTRKVQEYTGYDKAMSRTMANSIQAIVSTYDSDFKEVLQAADTLMSQFGISGEKALNIISDGFAAGANENGNFLSLMKQYAPTFRDAGIEASALAAYIAQTKSGLFNEDGLKLITVATKNIRNMSKATKESLKAIGIDADDMIQKLNSGQIKIGEAINQISKKLKELNPQSQEVGAVLQDVFGKKGSEAGYQLVAALSEVSDNLLEVKEKTGEWGKVMDDLKKAHEGVNEQMAILLGTDWQIETLGTKIETFLLKNVEYLLKDLNDAVKLFNQLFGGHIPTASVGGGNGYSGGGSGGGSRGETSTPTSTNKPEIKTTGGGRRKTGGTKAAKYTTNEEYLRKELAFNDKIRRQLEEKLEKERQITAEKEKQQRLDAVKKAAQGSPELKQQIDYLNKLQEANEKRKANKEAENQEKLNNAYANTASILSSAAMAMQAFGDSEAGQIGAIIANTMATVAQALAAGTLQALSMPFPASLAGYAAIASIIASVIAQIGSLKGFAEGGIVGGNRTIGDMNLARVNSGEMILNGRQQRNLFNIINSSNGTGSNSEYANVKFRISGNDLVGVLNNYNNKRGKAR